ncbi:MAG: protein-S-isoprenylcysteine O-methyltransferase Ste14 [Rhodothermales bacterium]|jgi:protein-S-isoprenylcysteine O-methyltransferase Ste14
MRRILIVFYGVVAYVVFLVSFLYAIGFVGNLVVPKSIDSGMAGSLTSSILINILLLSLFAVQHSVMARPAFKRAWTKLIPESIERSTYVLLSSLILLLLYWKWVPMTGVVWDLSGGLLGTVLTVVFGIGWLTVLLSTFMISHFELFGLRQVLAKLGESELPKAVLSEKGLYRYVRHPIMLGFIIAFWATPTMSVGHLLFAGVTTAYILVAVRIEEGDLVAYFGDTYTNYRERVGMIIPSRR